jgi:hypothetical protein
VVFAAFHIRDRNNAARLANRLTGRPYESFIFLLEELSRPEAGY